MGRCIGPVAQMVEHIDLFELMGGLGPTHQTIVMFYCVYGFSELM